MHLVVMDMSYKNSNSRSYDPKFITQFNSRTHEFSVTQLNSLDYDELVIHMNSLQCTNVLN